MQGGKLTKSIAEDSPLKIITNPTSKISMTIAFVIVGLSFFLGIYHLFSAYFGQADARLHRSTHLTVILILTFLYFPFGRKSWKSPINALFIIDLILIGLALMVQLYTCWDISKFLLREANQYDIIVGTICFILVLEATRRSVGWIMSIIAGFFLFQTLYSDLLFGIFYGPPMSWRTSIDFLFMQAVGVYGVALGAMATYIILFIIFGAILMQSGAGSFFIDLATALTGNRVGGSAKAAVTASAVMGTISGTAVGNVVTTGAFTIPLMIQSGYKRTFAAATEAVASCGGQIMPPIMGASAFIIAEFMGIPYLEVVLAALIPALLYFFGVFVMVDLEARKEGYQVLKKEELPDLKPILKKGGHLLLPLIVIIVTLIMGYTVMMAGFFGIIITIVITMIKKETRMSPFQFLEAFITAAKGAIPVAVACASAGLIVGSIEISGLGIKFSSLIIESSHGILFLALIFTMVASIILGMGLPTVAIYITLSAIVVPALIKMGVYPLAAHLFVFYFGVLGFVTPPVCVAAFAAAGIADSNPMKTGFYATKLGMAGFIVPFLFAYEPKLLFVGSYLNIFWGFLSAVVGVIALGGALQGWLIGKANIAERLSLTAGAFLLIKPGLITDGIGFAILSLVVIIMSARNDMIPLKRSYK